MGYNEENVVYYYPNSDYMNPNGKPDIGSIY